MSYQERKKEPQKKLTVGVLKEMLEGINPNAEIQIRFGHYQMRMGEKIGVYAQKKGDTFENAKVVYLLPIEKPQNDKEQNEEPPQK